MRHIRTIAVSCGPVSGGFYMTRERICLGRVAITWIGVAIDELMHSFVNECELQRQNAELRRKLEKARKKSSKGRAA